MNALQARLFEPVIAIHVSAALISVVLGLAILLRRKGAPVHILGACLAAIFTEWLN